MATQAAKPDLLRQLGVVSATALVVSNMVGTGIFTTSGFLAGIGTSVILVAACSTPKTAEVVDHAYPYAPAFKDRKLLHVFPLNGAADSLTLPIEATQFAYSQDGKSVYGSPDSQSGIFKIELEGMRISEVNTNVRGGFGLAVSRDETRVIVSRTYLINGSQVCGLFEFRGRPQDPGLLAENPECGPNKNPMAAALSAWNELNLSPDGERVVAHSRNGLVVIDLTRHTIQPLLGRFAVGSWSPNGKWLAVVEETKQRRTILLDAKSLMEQKILGTSGAQWSPDSRYLLGVDEDLTCGPYWATFHIIEVESGKRMTVDSSKCKVNLGGIGWIKRV